MDDTDLTLEDLDAFWEEGEPIELVRPLPVSRWTGAFEGNRSSPGAVRRQDIRVQREA